LIDARSQHGSVRQLLLAVRAAVSETKSGDALTGVGNDRLVHGGEGVRGADGVVAESLDAQ
jgi:hypothetical protein